MCLKLVLLRDFIIRVDNDSLLISTNQILLIICPAHGLYTILMHRGRLLVFKIWRIPNYNLTWWSTSDYSLASLHPLDSKERVSLFMFLFSKILWAGAFPIPIRLCKCWICKFAIGMMWINSGSISCIEVILSLMPVVGIRSQEVKLGILRWLLRLLHHKLL